MADREKNSRQPSSTTPDRFAETLPPEVAPTHSFSIQAMFELQRSFGKVEHAVEALDKRVEDQEHKLRNIERTVWLATGALSVIGVVGGFLIEHGFNRLALILATKH